MKWRAFEKHRLYEAEHFARKGNIAIHLMGNANQWLGKHSSAQTIRNFTNKDFAHVFGPDRKTLTEAVVSIGANAHWIQHPEHPNRMHFDVTGKILKKALAKCDKTIKEGCQKCSIETNWVITDLEKRESMPNKEIYRRKLFCKKHKPKS